MNLEVNSCRNHGSSRQKRKESWISRFKWFRFYPRQRFNTWQGHFKLQIKHWISPGTLRLQFVWINLHCEDITLHFVLFMKSAIFRNFQFIKHPAPSKHLIKKLECHFLFLAFESIPPFFFCFFVWLFETPYGSILGSVVAESFNWPSRHLSSNFWVVNFKDSASSSKICLNL